MKNRLLLLVTTLTLFANGLSLRAQGTAFTYQGRLNDGTNPATGTYDLRFALFDAAGGGSQVGTAITNSALDISGGIYTVTLDYGAGIFTGAGRWLEMGVRTNGGGAFTTLTPRNAIAPTPYAITAGNVTGVVPAGSLSGTYSNAVTFNNAANTFTGDGAGLTALNATQLSGPIPASSLTNAWKVTGNAGTTAGVNFLGTTDNQPLELKVNNLRALRIEDNGDSGDSGTTPDGAPNLIAGSPGNFVGAGVVGATIGGGGATNYGGFPQGSLVESDFGTVGGGRQNTISTSSEDSTIGGGRQNTIFGNSRGSTIGGGENNSIEIEYATIAGGENNSIDGESYHSAIGGGLQNIIAGDSTASTIAGGYNNFIDYSANRAGIGGGENNFIGSSSSASTIAGGINNYIGGDSESGAIGGGENNIIEDGTGAYATIAGGYNNYIDAGAYSSTIGGGYSNTNAAYAEYATIPGGYQNAATNYAFAAGRRAKANHTGAFVWADSQDADFTSTGTNQFLIRASGGVGIGTASPSFPLSVRANTGAMPISWERYVSGVPSGKTWGWEVDGSGTYLRNATDVTLPLTILNGGSVGIGRTPAANLLEVEGNASKSVAGSWLANSDARIKTDIQTLSGALDTLSRVRLVSFRYADDYRMKHPVIEDRRYLNIVAQEFREVFPEHVKSSGEKLDAQGGSILQADTYPLTIYSAAAIQELSHKLEEQKTENSALKARLEKLEMLVNDKQNRGAK